MEKLQEYVKEIHIILFIFVINNTSIIQDVLKKSLSFQALQEKFKDMYNIEKMLAVRNKYLAQFSQTWNIYKGVLY